jgi:hypothetical protein
LTSPIKAWYFVEVNGKDWNVMERDRDKPADVRVIIPRDIARELRKRAREERRTLAAQVLIEIERSIADLPNV